MRTTLEERFWAKVAKGIPGECWLWTGALVDGYGQIRRGGAAEPRDGAHRISYELHNGPIPAGLYVLHTCDVRACVQPDHLYAGTHQDNMNDMARRGRVVSHAKVDADDVRAIRRKFAAGEQQKDIATEYGLNAAYVSQICCRHVRKDVE